MARPPSKHPTDLELEILKILWRNGPSTGRQIRDALADVRDLAYTSVMTVLNIMTRKGYLARSLLDAAPGETSQKPATGTVYVYRARVTERSTTRRMLRDLVDRAFDGSAASLMLNLIETSDIDEKELKQLRALINKKRVPVRED